ncbi:MAG: ChpI protein [bacterium]|nr:ChpI protein [bacterium]
MTQTVKKIDVSIPNPIFKSAEHLSKRLGMSISDFYTVALAFYVATYKGNNVTKELNRLYGMESSIIEPELVKIQAASLEDENW